LITIELLKRKDFVSFLEVNTWKRKRKQLISIPSFKVSVNMFFSDFSSDRLGKGNRNFMSSKQRDKA